MSEIPEDIVAVARRVVGPPTGISKDGTETAVRMISAAIFAERKRCAYIARNACLVPPDGGAPTEAEVAVCEEAVRRIMGNWIADCGSDVDDERLANAKLFAAAPDMLSSLRTVDAFLTHLNQSWEFCEHSQAMHDAVKAAISKAEPESPKKKLVSEGTEPS